MQKQCFISQKACYQYFVVQKTVLNGLLPIFLSLLMSMLFFHEWILWWRCRSCVYFKLHDWKIPEAAFLFRLCNEGNSNSLWAPIITLWFWSFIKNWNIDRILPFFHFNTFPEWPNVGYVTFHFTWPTLGKNSRLKVIVDDRWGLQKNTICQECKKPKTCRSCKFLDFFVVNNRSAINVLFSKCPTT